MGDFRIVIEATGGHGCDRKAKEGEKLVGCGRMDCPDCVTAAFVSQMQRLSMRPFVASFTHWPAIMDRHLFSLTEKRPAPEDRCFRCNTTAKDYEDALATGKKDYPATCRTYDDAHEVVDDYSERKLDYPTGGFSRATGVRVKGHF